MRKIDLDNLIEHLKVQSKLSSHKMINLDPLIYFRYYNINKYGLKPIMIIYKSKKIIQMRFLSCLIEMFITSY